MLTWLAHGYERLAVLGNKVKPQKYDSWGLIRVGSLLGVLTIVGLFYTMPFTWALSTSLRPRYPDTRLSNRDNVLVPQTQATFHYQGRDLKLYYVKLDGGKRQLAVLNPARGHVTFIDPTNPDGPRIVLPVRIVTLERVMVIAPHPENYIRAMNSLNFSRTLLNTTVIAVVSTFASLISSSLVAYGFARLRVPFAKYLFMLLIVTMILPPQVTYLPLFIYYHRLGLVGTILPLIIPFFFSSGFSVFLLRQYFMTIPSEIDDAAKVDGANPVQTFRLIIIPQSRAALVTVALFQFMGSWGDYYWPMLVTSTNRSAQPLSVALSMFISVDIDWPHMMAGAVLTSIIPIIVFFLCQRNLIQGIVLTGVER